MVFHKISTTILESKFGNNSSHFKKSWCIYNIYIDGLVNRGVLAFTMLRTYTSLMSGLSAWKSESNSGDATISLRMVNKDTS
jgi:hypothetical protein